MPVSSSNSRFLYAYTNIYHSVLNECDRTEFYWDAKDAIPMNAPEPQGKEVDIHMFINNDHAVDQIFCRGRSGFLIYMNTAHVQWFS